MRPPRAVILFRGDERWRSWARLALIAAGKTWAGGGHLLVPYSSDGRVSRALLGALEKFDPDHILVLSYTLVDEDRVWPGLRTVAVDGTTLEGEDRAQLLAQAGDTFVGDDAGEHARRQLEEYLTPFIFHIGEDGERHQLHSTFPTNASSPMTYLGDALELSVPHIAISSAWDGDVALQVGGMFGLTDAAFEGIRAAPADGDLLRHAFKASGTDVPPELWTGAPSQDAVAKTRTAILDASVSELRLGLPDDAGAVVIGDSAEDFSLAMAYRLLLGTGMWISDAMLADQDLLERGVGASLSRLRSDLRHDVDALPYTSASLGEADLKAAAAKLEAAARKYSFDLTAKEADVRSPGLGRGALRRAIVEGAGDFRSVPVTVEEDGTMTTVAGRRLKA